MKYLIVANWKTNPETLAEAQEIFDKIKNGFINTGNAEVVICPPYKFLKIIGGAVSDSVKVGTQDFVEDFSVDNLKEINCEYIILGHSEKRINLNETNEMVNKKIKTALANNLRPIICVGDKKRESKEDFSEVISQIKEGLNGIEAKDAQSIIIAYEPIWAISTMGGRVATVEDIKESVNSIEGILSELFGESIASKMKILYGGSVNSDNIKKILSESSVSGALIGAASLKADEFIKIINNI